MIRCFWITVLSVLSLALIFPRQIFALAAAGTSAAPYLKMPMGTRQTGIGEAFTGIADDTSSLYYNPAVMAQISATEVSGMYMLGFGGINYSNVVLAAPAENFGIDVWGSLGLTYTQIAIDNVLRTKAQSDGSYDQAYADNNFTFTSGGTIIGLAYAWQATKMFSLGGSVKV